MKEDCYSIFNHECPNTQVQFRCLRDAVVNKDIVGNSCDEHLTGMGRP